MIQTDSIKEIRHIVAQAKSRGEEIALIPTMGYLHEGHLSLVEKAKEKPCFIVMSIFVNPLQFGPNEDYARYPRNLRRDLELAEKAGVNAIFSPSVSEMYPEPPLTTVEVQELSSFLCGANRAGHFTGVATVVSKLLNIVQPDRAFFGQKDYQQVSIIRRMVQDMNIPTEIVACPIVRENDGLAKSSRNVYLSEEQRREAVILNKSLEEGRSLINEGEKDPRIIEQRIKSYITQGSSGEIDYVEVRDALSLKGIGRIEKPVVIALAVKFGTTRLIDNIVVEV